VILPYAACDSQQGAMRTALVRPQSTSLLLLLLATVAAINLQLCPMEAPLCLGMDCQQLRGMSVESPQEGFPHEAGRPQANTCVRRPWWLRFPGMNLREASGQPMDFVNQSQRLRALWPQPASTCGNLTCSANSPHCAIDVFAHLGSTMPECDRHHLFELLAFFHDVARAHGIVYWANYGTLLGAHREGGHIGHEGDIDLGVRLADAPLLVKALQAAIKERGLPYDAFQSAQRALLYYSATNRVHIDMWYCEIGLTEQVDDRAVGATLQMEPMRFEREAEGVWSRAWSSHLKVRASIYRGICTFARLHGCTLVFSAQR